MFHCYVGQVYHERRSPKRHAFRYRMVLWDFDLDALDAMADAMGGMFAHNRFGWYSFHDGDPLPNDLRLPLKARVNQALADFGLPGPAHRVRLLSNPRVLGVGFNPLSVYFCYDADGRPLAALAEVQNTFYEQKIFPVPLAEVDAQGQARFFSQPMKHYYVSPFTALDTRFEFRFDEPGETLSLCADVLPSDGGEPILISQMTGRRQLLTRASLLAMSLRDPWMPLQVLGGIHWHALQLWRKGVPFHRKEAHPEAQVGVMRPHRSLKSLRGFN